MTADNGMTRDDETLPVGWERTIYHLQQRIRLLEAALSMAMQIIQNDIDEFPYKAQLAEMEKLLNG